MNIGRATSTLRSALRPARIARSLSVILVLTLIQTVSLPILNLSTSKANADTLYDNRSQFLQWNTWTSAANHIPYSAATTNQITSNTDDIYLTQDVGAQSGYLWNTQTVTLTQDFAITALYNLGSNDAGADGIAFSLRPLSQWPNGGASGGNSGPVSSWGSQNINVTFDTYQNGSEIAADHLNIYATNSTGNVTNYSGNGVSLKNPDGSALTNIEDNVARWYTIRWLASTRTFSVWAGLDTSATSAKIFESVITTTEQDVNTFAFGWAGFTGGASNLQRLNNIQYHIGPVINSGPSDTTVVDGTSVTLTAAYTATAAAPTTRWEYSTDGGSTWTTTGTTTASYTFTANRALNKRMYRFYVATTMFSYTFTNNTVPITLTVNPPPLGFETDTALSLNGTNQYAEVADATGSPFDLTGTLTLEAWVYPTSTCSGSGAVISKLSYLLYCSVGVWKVMLLADGATGSGVASSIPVAANEWHHIAVTKSAASSTTSFYYDGILVDNLTTTGAMTPNNHAFQIGRWDNNSYYFPGKIDEVRVYNTQRTQAQIQSDMHSYGNTSETGLVAYYDFNEGSGTTLYNRVSTATNATDLTISNSPSWSDIKTVDTTTLSAYTIVKFPRSYLTSAGGWKVPANVSKASALVVAGGGGGGSRAGGGGGAGGLVYRQVLSLTANAFETITVGQGGVGGLFTSVNANHQGINGQNSQMGSHTSAIGGGGGGGAGETGNTYRAGLDGGSGGGAAGAAAGDGSSAAYGLATQSSAPRNYGLGNRGGSGVSGSYWNGGGGGGSGGVGSHSSTTSWVAGNGGAGTLDPVGGSNLCLAAGGGGGTINTGTSAGSAGTCSSGTVTAGAGTIGSVVGVSATSNSGSGGGASGYSGSADADGGNGGSGVVYVRWITALKPTYTKPVNAYLNVGMTETFTTNVLSDSATVGLTRTFRWESTTTGANGTFTLIKQGTGATNAAFSWVPTDTSTSGSNYLYRLIVTDSDTAGLFITDSSTAFAVINRTLVMTGVSIIKKAINVSRTDTYTVTFGTPTYRVTLTPVISGITLDTSTITAPIIRIADTTTVGTYYETLTVTDSVSASVVIPLTITITAPPNLLNTAEIVSDNLVFNLEAGNSASLISESGTVTTALTWNDLSGSKANATTGLGVNTGGLNGTTCTAPKYTADNGGALTFASASTNCYYASGFSGKSLINNYTVEAWFKTSATLPNSAGIVGQSTPSVTVPVSIFIINYSSSGLVVGFYDHVNSVERYANCPYIPTIGAWTHIAGTYDGTTLTTYINGASRCTATASWTPNSTTNSLGMVIGKGPGGGSDTAFPGSIASIRMYNKPLTAAQILSNFNATKFRFDPSNDVAIVPTKKYGASTIETFTVTSGSDTRTITFSVGGRNGIDWDTSTVANQVKLTLQESLTVGTYLDTVTVTDALGQSTYIPFRMTTTKADTLTVTMSASTTITYNGSALTVYPKPMITGLKWTDTATTISRFSSVLYSETTTIPVNADTYTVRGSVPIFTIGSIDNYLGITYDTATATINKANQKPLNIYMYGGTVGTPYLISLQGGSGTGAVNETLTGVATLTGCAISNHYLTAAEQKQGYCEVRVVKDGDQNYWSETQTVQLYFMAYINGQPTGVIGSGNGIGINGVTSYSVDTTTPPSITGLSTLTLSIAGGGTFVITGTGFSASGLTVKFWRNKVVTPTGSTSTSITFNVSDIGTAGATSGRITVITVNGQDFSTDTLTITP